MEGRRAVQDPVQTTKAPIGVEERSGHWWSLSKEFPRRAGGIGSNATEELNKINGFLYSQKVPFQRKRDME